jgi:signal transduction histidine kinase
VQALNNLVSISIFRWLVAFTVIFVLTASGAAGYIFWQTSRMLADQEIQTLSAEIKGLREQFELGGVKLLNQVIEQRSRSPGSGLYLLSSPEGIKLSGNLSGFPSDMVADAAPHTFQYTRAGEPVTDEREAVGLAIAVPGGYALVVARDAEDRRRLAATMRTSLLLSMALVATVGLGGGLLASRGILARVAAMAATTEAIMAGSLERRLPIDHSGDEFDRLARSVNFMLDRIEILMTGMRDVSSNIAHDLRTPLTRMRNRLETALREPGHGTVQRSVLERTIEEADELIKTFNAMLNLARIEAGAAGERVKVDLGELVSSAAELYEPLADMAGYELQATVVPGLFVCADRQLLGQAVTNLIDNAIKYGGRIEGVDGRLRPHIKVGAVPDGPNAAIVVADSGPGIPEFERERALERFVRLHPSRSLPGSGLGLSLVAAVARLHGGVVRLEDNAPGLRVVIALPRSAELNGADLAQPSNGR